MSNTTPSLRTARALLRPFARRDAGAAHRVFGDAEVMRFAAGEPDADVDATRRRLARYAALQAARGFSKWGAWRLETGAYLGDAGLTVLPETGEIELGYRLARARWGQGLATEIAAAWLGYALGELGLARVIAFADPRNLASLRVMAKIGMTFARADHLAGMDCVVYEARREEVHRGDG
ncbi:MAG: GNAT family N-acetyltransferase [Nannocystaceae bacterium]